MAGAHWHGFAYTGNTVPPDSAARDNNQAVPPREIVGFFSKPATMRRGVFSTADAALGWLEEELRGTPPIATGLPVESHLEGSGDCLSREADAYVGYYTAAGGFMVRALLACPREGVRCPQPPS
jgi:hypothetical protein